MEFVSGLEVPSFCPKTVFSFHIK